MLAGLLQTCSAKKVIRCPSWKPGVLCLRHKLRAGNERQPATFQPGIWGQGWSRRIDHGGLHSPRRQACNERPHRSFLSRQASAGKPWRNHPRRLGSGLALGWSKACPTTPAAGLPRYPVTGRGERNKEPQVKGGVEICAALPIGIVSRPSSVKTQIRVRVGKCTGAVLQAPPPRLGDYGIFLTIVTGRAWAAEGANARFGVR